MFMERLEREGTVWSNLRHVNILPFYGLMTILDETYLVSPWVRYGDLSKFVPARMRYLALPESERLQDETRSAFETFNEYKMVTRKTFFFGIRADHWHDSELGSWYSVGDGLPPLPSDHTW